MQRPALLCYDGSDDARAAIRAAGALIDRPALVATVWVRTRADYLGTHLPALGPALRQAFDELDANAATAARQDAEEGCTLARENGFVAEPIAIEESPGVPAALVRLAEERDVAVIVLGRRGLSPVSATLFGSVSTGVLHHARCPVLAVPANDGQGSAAG